MKNKIVLYRLILWCTFFLPLALLAQHQPAAHVSTMPWQLDATVDGVQFYHAITTCGGENVVLLKFNNQNKTAVKVSWEESFVTRQIPKQTDGLFGPKNLVLPPGETAAADCAPAKCTACLIGPDGVSPAYKATITQFSFQHIIVTPQ